MNPKPVMNRLVFPSLSRQCYFRAAFIALVCAGAACAQQNPVLHYTFDEGGGTIAGDSSGSGNDGALVNGPAWSAGKIGGGLTFNGGSSVSGSALATKKTVAFWLRTSARVQQVLFDAGTTGTQSRAFQIALARGGIGSAVNFPPDDSPGLYIQFWINGLYIPQVDLQDGRWHHITVSWEGRNVFVEIDGKFPPGYINATLYYQQVRPQPFQLMATPNPSVVPIMIGAGRAQLYSTGLPHFNGEMDDIIIYDRQLSQAEILGLSTQIPPDAAVDSYATLAGNTLDVGWPGVLANDVEFNGETMTAALDSDAQHGSLSLNADGGFTYVPQAGFSGTDYFTYHAVDFQGNASASTQVLLSVGAPSDGLILHYPLDEGFGAAADDVSGNGNNGSILNAPFGSGVTGSGLDFDGKSSSLAAAAISNIRSVSLWIKTTAALQHNFFDAGSIGVSQGFTIGLTRGAIGGTAPEATPGVYVSFGMNDVYVPDIDLTDGEWHHLSVSWDGMVGLLVGIDGNFPDGYTFGGAWCVTRRPQPFVLPAIPTTVPQPLMLGRSRSLSWGAGSLYFLGSLDDVRLFNRSLTQGEIKALIPQLPPRARNDTYIMRKNSVRAFTVPGILANDSEVNFERMTAVLDTDVSNGALTLNADGSLLYQPSTDFTGVDSFTYHAEDIHGNPSAPAIVTLNVIEPLSGLGVHLPFDDQAGVIVNDVSANANNGLMLNATRWSTGPRGGAASFDGLNDSVRISRSPSIEPPTITVAFWANISDPRLTGNRAMVRAARAGNGNGYALSWNTGNTNFKRVGWGIAEGGGTQTALDHVDNSAYANQWHHFAGTYDTAAELGGLFIDGVHIINNAGHPLGYSEDVYMMTTVENFLAPLRGKLSDFRIYQRQLTNAEIAALAQAAPTTTTVTGIFFTPYIEEAHDIPLTAQVASPLGTVSDGQITFKIKRDGTTIGTLVAANVNNYGSASTQYTLPAGTAGGVYQIEADYFGIKAFAGSSGTGQLVVQNAPTQLSASNVAAAVSAVDQTVLLPAFVVCQGGVVTEGSVTFQIKDGETLLGSPAAGAVVNGGVAVQYILPGGTPLGTYTIDASYAGVFFLPSSDNSHTLKIVQPGTTLASDAVAGFRSVSQTITLNATVTDPSGPVSEGRVTFQVKRGDSNIGSAALSAVVSNGAASANYTLPASTPAGVYSIHASYSGSGNFAPSADTTKTLTINLATTTTTAASASASYSANAQPVALTAQVTSIAGTINESTVTFQLRSGAQNVGSAVTSGALVNGTANVSYILPGGSPPGIYTIEASYGGSENFIVSSDNTKTLAIQKATPQITWDNPAGITYGVPLDVAQLNASAATPGTFDYTPPAGAVLHAGNNQPLSVTFTPADSANFNTAQKSVAVNVLKKSLSIVAENKSRLYGSANPPLTVAYSGFVNNDTAAALTGAPALTTPATAASVPGNYPIVVSAGTLSAADYTFMFVNGTFTVLAQPEFSNLSAPNVPYATPETVISGNITAGTPGSVNISFNGVTRSASIFIDGFFAANFDTASIELGSYPIHFDYPGSGFVEPASASATLTIIKAAPSITWAVPANVTYGTALSNTQLNASANVNGTIVYVPPEGTVLSAGSHQLSVDFKPADAAHYVSTSASVTLSVEKAGPALEWAAPADIVYGEALSEMQLSAACKVPGVFNYDPPAGTTLSAGFAQELIVMFEPDDSSNYVSVTASVAINVLKADQSIAFAPIADPEIGDPPVNIVAIATSNLPVVVTLVSGPAALEGNTLTLLNLGPVTLRGEQDGDENFNAAPALEITFNIVRIAPRITSPFSAGGTQGSSFEYMATASGTKPITFSAHALPPGLSLDPATGMVSGTPTASGAFQAELSALNQAGSDTRTVTFVFASSSGNENHSPYFLSNATASPNPAAVNQEITFGAVATDDDGDSVAFAWDFGDGSGGASASPVHRYTAAGIYNARVTVSDAVSSDYLNLTIVINTSVIPGEQYAQFTVLKLALKYNFAAARKDSLSVSGMLPVPAGFSPEGKIIIFSSGNLDRSFTLDKKGVASGFKLTGKLAKNGTFTASPVKFALSLKNENLFAGLEPLGFVNDNTPKGMLVRMPIVVLVEETRYLNTVLVKYAAKKGKSGSGKK